MNILKKQKIIVLLIIVCIPLLIINHKFNNIRVMANKLDNRYYLPLKDDPNADDASVISKSINALLKGELHYPIREDNKKVVYLTFDDGPSLNNTSKILNILDKHNVKATFFVTGKALNANDKAKKLLKEIAKNGHSIGNHTYSHNYHYLYPGRIINVNNVICDLKKNNKLIQSILGKDFSTRIIRLPGGYRTWEGKKQLKNKMDELGIKNIDWNALNGDAEGKKKNSNELFMYLKKTVKKLGDDADSITILMHDAHDKGETVKSLPKVIEYFENKGFQFKTIK